MKLQNRIILLSLATSLVGGFVYSQIYIHEKNRVEFKEVAREISLNWKAKLGLSEEQTLLLEDNIIEFTIIKNEIIRSSHEKPTIIQNLQRVQVRELKKLRKIFNETQFEAYVGIDKNMPSQITNSLSNS